MSRANHPLKVWLLNKGYGDQKTGVIGAEDWARFAAYYASHCKHPDNAPTAESWRLIVNGHRKPSWDLCFDLEMITLGELVALDLRDDSYYCADAA